jgi:metal-dependent hydrolase (beta-lactamase superfamily II)
MGLRFCLLASGSKGNAVYIESKGQAVLVDNGLSGVELVRRMESVGLDPARIKSVILTHEHRDHSSGAGISSLLTSTAIIHPERVLPPASSGCP